MEAIPRSYDECRFDAFCKSVLRNEAHNYRRGLKCQRDRQVSISALSQADMDKLSTVDHYPSDSYIFSSHGYDLGIVQTTEIIICVPPPVGRGNTKNSSERTLPRPVRRIPGPACFSLPNPV